jgi:Ca-activated chloride channel family protein
MPGWDTTLRLSKRVAGVFLLLTIAIYAATQTGVPVEAAAQTESTPQSLPENKPESKTADPQTGSTPAAAPDNSQTANPQTTKPQESSHDNRDNNALIIRKDVDEVLLHASVIDNRERIVTDLDKSAFSVTEDGKPQTIISFRHEDVPVAMAVVIDNSGSMREKRNKVNQAALNLVRASNPRDQVCIVNFNDEYYLDQDFTNDLLKLKEALEKIDARGGTALYEAVVASADHLRRNAQLEKKVLFVVTDGEDNASLETLEQAVKQLQGENGPAVYAIGILGEEEHPKRARRALEQMAERTGGIAFFPRTLDEVDEISRTVARDIRSQYTIGYKPTNPRGTGGFRTVHVEAKAKGHGKMTVRTKSGYYAGPQGVETLRRQN